MAQRFLPEEKDQASVTPAKKSSKLWLWIGGGVILAGGITAAILLSQPKTVHKKETDTRDFSLNTPNGSLNP